jgi:hypothetical protein
VIFCSQRTNGSSHFRDVLPSKAPRDVRDDFICFDSDQPVLEINTRRAVIQMIIAPEGLITDNWVTRRG